MVWFVTRLIAISTNNPAGPGTLISAVIFTGTAAMTLLVVSVGLGGGVVVVSGLPVGGVRFDPTVLWPSSGALTTALQHLPLAPRD